MTPLRLATRGSLLARTQSGHVAAAITAATGRPVELVIVRTRGDEVTDRPLQQVGGKGLFTKEIEEALLAGDADLAVHSMKDLPSESPDGLVIGAVPTREDPRDVLVGSALGDLPAGAVLGTGSVRRAIQLRALRPDLEIRGIRGNVDTRIAKQQSGEYAAVVLAAAGLARLGRSDAITEILDVDACVPAVGQGALAVQCRAADRAVQGVLEAIHDPHTAVCVAAERAFLEAVSGGCSAPAACHAALEGDVLLVRGVWATDADGVPARMILRSDPLHAFQVGRELAQRLKAGEGTR